MIASYVVVKEQKNAHAVLETEKKCVLLVGGRVVVILMTMAIEVVIMNTFMVISHAKIVHRQAKRSALIILVIMGKKNVVTVMGKVKINVLLVMEKDINNYKFKKLYDGSSSFFCINNSYYLWNYPLNQKE